MQACPSGLRFVAMDTGNHVGFSSSPGSSPLPLGGEDRTGSFSSRGGPGEGVATLRQEPRVNELTPKDQLVRMNVSIERGCARPAWKYSAGGSVRV